MRSLTILLLSVVVAGVAAWGGSTTATSGNSITSPDTAGDVGMFSSLALDASGRPVISYYDATNGNLRVLHCGNPSCTSGNTIASPDTVGDLGLEPSLALDDSGNPVVSYYDRGNGDLKVVHCGNPNCTGDNTITAPDTAGDVGYGTSLALDGTGNPVVSYYDGDDQDLKVLHCGNPNCTSGNIITAPDTVGDVGFGTSLTLDASGNPVVSYVDLTNADLKLLHCGNPGCTAGNTITAPDTVGDVGFAPSLALDSSGHPVVSYFDGVNGDLKLTHCNDANCSGSDESIASPDMEEVVGWLNSLALDANGNPVIGYYRLDGGDLKVVHCGNPNCTAGNTITVPDTEGDVGQHPSLALDTSGKPVISYSDVANSDLRVLHCGNQICTSSGAVGGTAEFANAAGTPVESVDSSGANTGFLAGIAAAVAAGGATLGGAAWYVRRRWPK